MSVDFGQTAADYGRHRAGFPEAFFERLAAFGVGRAGQPVLDLGTGTGTIARGLARRGCAVTGLDKSEALLGEARRLDAQSGVHVDYRVARAEQTGLPARGFEVVIAGQCWHWFERAQAALEARRLLEPHGRLVIAHFDWLALPENVVELTEALVAQHNPRNQELNPTLQHGKHGLYPAWLADVAHAGFGGTETFSFDVSVPYSHEGWRGRLRASAGVGASLPPEEVRRFDADLAELLRTRFPREPLEVPHRVWALVARR